MTSISWPQEKSFEIGNIDVTVCLERPKIKPIIPQMQEVIAAVMEVALDQVSIKATTTEKLGFVGAEDGVSAHCVALVYKA